MQEGAAVEAVREILAALFVGTEGPALLGHVPVHRIDGDGVFQTL